MQIRFLQTGVYLTRRACQGSNIVPSQGDECSETLYYLLNWVLMLSLPLGDCHFSFQSGSSSSRFQCA